MWMKNRMVVVKMKNQNNILNRKKKANSKNKASMRKNSRRMRHL